MHPEIKDALVAIPAFLQYGSLGLLALVLFGGGLVAYLFLGKLLSRLQELIDVSRASCNALAISRAHTDDKLETLIHRQESTIEALERIERSDSAGHTATQNQILMLRSTCSRRGT